VIGRTITNPKHDFPFNQNNIVIAMPPPVSNYLASIVVIIAVEMVPIVAVVLIK